MTEHANPQNTPSDAPLTVTGDTLKALEETDRQLDPDFDPEAEAEAEKQAELAEIEAEQQAQQEAQTSAEAAKMAGLMGLASIEGALKMLVHPRFEFSEASRERAIRDFAPLLVKYGTLVPQWMATYAPEIQAAHCAFGLIMEGRTTLATLKAEDAANDKQPEAA